MLIAAILVGCNKSIASFLANEDRGAIGGDAIGRIGKNGHALDTFDNLNGISVVASESFGENYTEGKVDGSVGILANGYSILSGFDIPE